MIEMDGRRLRDALHSNAPDLFKDELKVLCLATGTGLDFVFDLPKELADDKTVMQEYKELFPNGQPNGKLYSCGPGKPPSEIEVMRSLVELRCLKMCLNSYPAAT
jgi:hypothetical protein